VKVIVFTARVYVAQLILFTPRICVATLIVLTARVCVAKSIVIAARISVAKLIVTLLEFVRQSAIDVRICATQGRCRDLEWQSASKVLKLSIESPQSTAARF
jgi:hypothetical protein